MGETTLALGNNPSKSIGGGDPEDLALSLGGILIDSDGFTDARDRVYDVRGIKQFSFSITNQDATDSLDWVLQQTEDPVPVGGDMAGATWVDIDAVAALAALATAKKEFTRTTLLTSAVRLRTKRTAAAGDSTFKGRFAIGNYL